MRELVDTILRSLGGDLTLAEVDLIATIVGGVLIAVVAVVVVRFVIGRLSRTIAPAASTRLLPTLAEDALDDDLRGVYAKTLWLDTLLAKYAAEFASPTGSRLGRAARKSLVGEQARRYRESQARRQEKSEPPSSKEARLDDVEAALDEAIGAVDAQLTRDEPLADLLERLVRRVESAQK